jgi:hypothetical protein
MKTVGIPVDAYKPGDVVETGEGRLGEIVMHGWDAEGSFGYLVRCGRTLDRTWVYHHRELQVWKKKQE